VGGKKENQRDRSCNGTHMVTYKKGESEKVKPEP